MTTHDSKAKGVDVLAELNGLALLGGVAQEVRDAVAELVQALERIRDYKGHPATPVANSVKKSAIARAALKRIGGE